MDLHTLVWWYKSQGRIKGKCNFSLHTGILSFLIQYLYQYDISFTLSRAHMRLMQTLLLSGMGEGQCWRSLLLTSTFTMNNYA